jgi:hypothetical protein
MWLFAYTASMIKKPKKHHGFDMSIEAHVSAGAQGLAKKTYREE